MHIQESRCVVTDSCSSSDCMVTAHGLVSVSSQQGWNGTPIEPGIATRAISHTSAVIRVKDLKRTSVTSPPPPVTHDPLSEGRTHNHTHSSVPPAHTWNQSVDIEPGPVLSKMQRLWTDDLFTGRRKAGYHVARSGTHDVDAARVVGWNRRSSWYATDDSGDTYKYSDRAQTDADLWNKPGLPSVLDSTVPACTGAANQWRHLREYLDHKFCIQNKPHDAWNSVLLFMRWSFPSSWNYHFWQLQSMPPFFSSRGLSKAQEILLTPDTGNGWDVWRSQCVDMCQLFFFFFSDQFEAHLCVLLQRKWIFSSRIPHRRVCVFTRSFQCVVGRQNMLRTDLWFSSGFAFSPGFRPEIRRWKLGVKQSDYVAHEWLMFAIFLLLGGSAMALLIFIQFSFILSFQKGALL